MQINNIKQSNSCHERQQCIWHRYRYMSFLFLSVVHQQWQSYVSYNTISEKMLFIKLRCFCDENIYINACFTIYFLQNSVFIRKIIHINFIHVCFLLVMLSMFTKLHKNIFGLNHVSGVINLLKVKYCAQSL